MAEQKTSVKIGPVRIGFAAIWKPKKQLNSDKMKYSVKLYIPKDNKALIREVSNAIKAAAAQGVANGTWGGKEPTKIRDFRWALRDGDKEDSEGDSAIEGHFFLTASSDSKPGIVKKQGSKIIDVIDEDEVYSGAYCYVSVNFYPYNQGGGKGIAAGLGNVLKVKDGERMSGKPSAESDFGDLDIETADDDGEDFLPFADADDDDDFLK